LVYHFLHCVCNAEYNVTFCGCCAALYDDIPPLRPEVDLLHTSNLQSNGQTMDEVQARARNAQIGDLSNFSMSVSQRATNHQENCNSGFQSSTSSHNLMQLEPFKGIVKGVGINQFQSHRFSNNMQSTPYRSTHQGALTDLGDSFECTQQNLHRVCELGVDTPPQKMSDNGLEMQCASSSAQLTMTANDSKAPLNVIAGNTIMSSATRGLNHFAVYLMSDWFDKNSVNPYPSAETKLHLANIGKISIAQVTSWFSHRRTREKRKLLSPEGPGEGDSQSINKRLKLDSDS